MIAIPRLALLAAACSSVTAFADPTITNLGHLGGNYSDAAAISGNGNVVVGETFDLSSGRAFRWTQADGMTDLGTLGGAFANATAVSHDGSVIVGNSSDGSSFLAFRWTQVGGMVSLGTLGGLDSYATGVCGLGIVVTGKSNNGTAYRAFRWTQAGGMTDLGHLGGGSSEGFGISADGSVIVGESYTGSYTAAFRWTQAGGMANLGTLGGSYSSARAASNDGSVIVGSSSNGSGNQAFRWTQADGMVSLGTLGGSFAIANAVSGDGSVVAGESSDGSNLRAFRWTQADGMTDIGTLGGNYAVAHGISADGSVIVGVSETSTNDYHAFLYRDEVMLDATDWLGSVAGVQSVLSNTLGLTRMFLEGAHHRPLGELGRGRSYWVTGDVAGSSRTRDVITRSGEAGVTFLPWSNVLVGLGAGYGLQDQQLLNDGRSRTSGQYLVGELDLLLADGGIFSVLLSAGDWDNRTNRGYVTGAGTDYSRGETDVKSSSFRLRYDSPVLARAFATDFKTYVSYGHSRARADGYVETDGSNPASFAGMEQTAEEGRLGIAATRSFGEKLRVRLSAEWIRRFDHDLAGLTAIDTTSLLTLALPTPDPVRDQARVGLDLDYLLDAQTTLSFTVQAAGRGESADVSGALSLRKAF